MGTAKKQQQQQQGRGVSLDAVWCIGAMPSSYAFLERAGKQPRGVGVHCGNERRRPPHFEAEPMEMTKGPYLNDVYTIFGILGPLPPLSTFWQDP